MLELKPQQTKGNDLSNYPDGINGIPNVDYPVEIDIRSTVADRLRDLGLNVLINDEIVVEIVKAINATFSHVDSWTDIDDVIEPALEEILELEGREILAGMFDAARLRSIAKWWINGAPSFDDEDCILATNWSTKAPSRRYDGESFLVQREDGSFDVVIGTAKESSEWEWEWLKNGWDKITDVVAWQRIVPAQ